MKRLFLMAIVLVAITQFVKAQSENITGSVRDKNGNYLHYAFVQDKQMKNATYTDSLGKFTLSVNPSSKLFISCNGYKDTLINIGNQTNFNVSLSSSRMVTENATTQVGSDRSNVESVKDVFTPNSNTNGNSIAVSGGSSFPTFNHKDATQGNKYLFSGWVHGFVVNAQDSVYESPKLFFNYDKMGGGLLLSQDQHSAIVVNKDMVKTFTLYDAANKPYVFANVPAIDNTHYVEVLSAGKNYRIYKTITTKFEKANFVDNGISSSGNNYDSYNDKYEYYVVNGKTNKIDKISLRPKSFKAVFADDKDKTNKFLADNSGDINDDYLKSLGDYLNQ
jgi:hypothetical protein